MDLTGRVAVVVGGTSGLGRVIALGLADAGAHVVATGRRQELVDEVSLGRDTLRQTVNVEDRKSVDELRDAVVKKFGHVDILLNAAGQHQTDPDHRSYRGRMAVHFGNKCHGDVALLPVFL